MTEQKVTKKSNQKKCLWKRTGSIKQNRKATNTMTNEGEKKEKNKKKKNKQKKKMMIKMVM